MMVGLGFRGWGAEIVARYTLIHENATHLGTRVVG